MEMTEGKQGLWANIHAKRKRIKAGSGERMRKPGSKGAPTDADFRAASKNEAVEVKDTDDYKLSSSGRKVKAHKIVFNKGEDDGKKGVSEQMRKSYGQFVQEHTPDLTEEQLNELVAELQEVLGKDDPAGEWISDFVHSDNPKFAGKSKEKRKQMALAAYYAKQRDEEVEIEEELKGNQHKLDKNKNGKLDKHDFKLLRKEDAEQVDEAESHQAKTTMKHVKNPTAGEKKAAKYIKPGIKGYRDRIAMLHSADAEGRLKKEETEQLDEIGDTPGGKQMLGRYIKKAARRIGVHASVAAQYADTAGSKTATPSQRRAASTLALNQKHKRDMRLRGVERATDRMTKEETEQVDEAWPGTPEYKKKFPDTERTTGAGARHDIKKTASGVIATRRYAADDTTEKPKDAPKRGRGRPKKDKFAEAVEFLMTLDEQQFNELTSEGFDAFFESFLTVVESK